MMTEFQKIRQKVVFKILEKFPNLSTRGIAIILYRDNPELFKDLENCRSVVRTARGQNGKKARKHGIKNKKYFKPLKNEI